MLDETSPVLVLPDADAPATTPAVRRSRRRTASPAAGATAPTEPAVGATPPAEPEPGVSADGPQPVAPAGGSPTAATPAPEGPPSATEPSPPPVAELTSPAPAPTPPPAEPSWAGPTSPVTIDATSDQPTYTTPEASLAEATSAPAESEVAAEGPAQPISADHPSASDRRRTRRARVVTPRSDGDSAGIAATGRSSRSRRAASAHREPATASGVAEAPALGDAIGEALNELSQSRATQAPVSRRRRAPKALDDLAAAIAGEAPPADAPDVPGAGATVSAQVVPASTRSTEVVPVAPTPSQVVPAGSPAADVIEPAEVATAEDEPAAEGDESSHRRRRRRGGRHHRKTETEAEPEVATGASVKVAEEAPVAAEASDDNDIRRRRRRRRRQGEENVEADDDPADVVVRVRAPRVTPPSHSEVTGIEGSTRLEAKRLRRREGRAASRHRKPILSEAEFLARRESVARTMVVRQQEDYSQIAVLEDGVLVEHYVDRAEATSLIGNVYLGRVQNVLPSMEAVFIDIGRGRNAVLFAGEIDWETLGAAGEQRKVEEVFTSGQTILVQVTKDPVGAKGARLASHISIPGRYVVYAPGGHLQGISRKLSEQERNRLKAILDEIVGHDASVIIRTAAEGATNDELLHDINRLKAQWEVIEKKVAKGSAPQLLYAEPDLTMRIVRDLFTEDFTELVVDGHGGLDDAFDTVQAYVEHVAPSLSDRVRRWDRSQGDLFAQYRIDEQIAKALDRKVHLPSGGTLIIDRTEAMTVIDVNTGKFTGSGGTLEATVTSNNLEAAEEIVRQLRLRDIGGIVVIDFIDMVLPSNRELLLRRLVECLSRDRTRHQVSEVTSLGLVQMTRKRVGSGLSEAFTVTCDQCGGLGYHRLGEPVEHQPVADSGERNQARRNVRRKDKAA